MSKPKLPSLKPCPFCGSLNVGLSGIQGGADSFVTCFHCNAEGPLAAILGRLPDAIRREAARLWNKRSK